jgi:nitrogen fixation protein NifB
MSVTPTTERIDGPRVPVHPCFDAGCSKEYARVHLPVAPRCNVQCRFCDRAFDCVNESRPGVTASLLTPVEAAERVDRLRERLPKLSVVGVAGPGDPLANPKETFAALRLVRDRHPDLLLCLATNGLALTQHADEIADLGVSHLTVTVNAVRPEVGAAIYSWVRTNGRALTGMEAAELLWERQREGIERAAARGLAIKINTILIPGVNEGEVASVAQACAAAGARFMNLIPLLPVKGTAFAEAGEPPRALVAGLRAEAAAILPQLAHCKRCRADAAGLLGQDLTPAELAAPATRPAEGQSCVEGRLPEGQSCVEASPGERRPSRLAAVASREGLLVNRHLGEADRLFVFRIESDGTYGTEDIRTLPEAGGGENRWGAVAEALADCDALFVAGIGAPPRRILEDRGIAVHVVEGLVSEALSAFGKGRDLSFLSRRAGCGGGCSGSASRGCGCA